MICAIKSRLNRWDALAAGLLVIASGGTVYTFGAYASTLKDTLRLSQTELEIAALCSNFGNYLGLAGFFFDAYGPVASVGVGASLIGLGYGGLWLLLRVAPASHGAIYASICCFVWGHGASYLDIATVGSVIGAFPRHRGAVVGLLKSMYGLASGLIVLFAAHWLSPANFVGALALVAFLLPLAFARRLQGATAGANEDEEDDATVGRRIDRAAMRVAGLATLLLAIAISRIAAPGAWESFGVNFTVSACVVLGLCWITRVGSDTGAKHGPEVTVAEGSAAYTSIYQTTAPRQTSLAGTVDTPPQQSVRSAEFWLLMLAVLPIAGMGLTTVNNLAQIISARGGSPATAHVAVSLVSIMNCLGRLATGRFADVLVARGTPRPALLVMSSVGGALAMAFLWATGTSVGCALVGIAVAGAAYGMLWTLIPTLASDLFGVKQIGGNSMLCLPTVLMGSVLYSTLLAPAVYKAHSVQPDDDGEAECLGVGCFGDTFIAIGLSCCVGALSALALYTKTRDLYKLRDASLAVNAQNAATLL